MAFVWPDALISSEFNHNALNSLKVRVSLVPIDVPMFDVIGCPGLRLQTVADCCRLQMFRTAQAPGHVFSGCSPSGEGFLGLAEWSQRLAATSSEQLPSSKESRESKEISKILVLEHWNRLEQTGTPWTISDDFGRFRTISDLPYLAKNGVVGASFHKDQKKDPAASQPSGWRTFLSSISLRMVNKIIRYWSTSSNIFM